MNSKKMFSIVLTVCLFAGAGCTTSEKVSVQQRTHARTVVIGLIPEQNLFRQMARYEPLADYLSEKTGTQVKLTILTRYGNIIDNFVSAGLDGAFFGSFTYALAHAKLGLQVLARPESLDGVSTYHGLIFVRKNSGIKSYREMRGKRFAFVDKATTAGYLFPLSYFKKRDVDYRSYLKEGYFTGTHEDAIYDVLNKKADIGAAKNTVFNRLAASDARIKNELIVLDSSFEVPENALALRQDLDGALREKFKTVLLNMHLNPQGIKVLEIFGAKRFVETTEADYQPIYRSAEEIRLDLATYNYRND
jgi:phosphonate transport system substrate-binding protein